MKKCGKVLEPYKKENNLAEMKNLIAVSIWLDQVEQIPSV